jgi:DinB superfamily
MKKSDITTPVTYFNRYIDLVDDISIGSALRESLLELDQINIEKLQKTGDATYAEGKWTIRQIIQHIIDWERIMGYRAVILARQAATPPLAGHDEQFLAQQARTDHRSLAALVQELRAVRLSTIALFEGLHPSELLHAGMANTSELCALAMGFTIVGHQRHHLRVIAERYEGLV